MLCWCSAVAESHAARMTARLLRPDPYLLYCSMTSAPPASPSRSPTARKAQPFGLTGLAPLRDVVRPPYRPEPGRGRGRPPLMAEDAIDPPALPPVPPLDRRPFDYSDLAHWMTQMDQTIRQARRALVYSACLLAAAQSEPDGLKLTIIRSSACPTGAGVHDEDDAPSRQ